MAEVIVMQLTSCVPDACVTLIYETKINCQADAKYFL